MLVIALMFLFCSCSDQGSDSAMLAAGGVCGG